MLAVAGSAHGFCDRIPRRDVLRAGVLGVAGLGLADLLRLRAVAGAGAKRPKSVIMVCLPGGPSHIDMYDMKPDAPAEYRGEFRPVSTCLPGLEICEHLPLQTRIADRFSVVRSLVFKQPDHQLHEVYTGFPKAAGRPALGSVISRMCKRESGPLPKYISLGLSDHPRTALLAERATYLGSAHGPYEPTADALGNLALAQGLTAERLQDRVALAKSLDDLRRLADARREMASFDHFQAQAVEMVTSEAVREAFDISREPASIRAIYGDDVKLQHNYQFGHTWHSTKFLLARRLVEAGVPIVTLCVGGWDDHGNVADVKGTIFQRSSERLPHYDRSLTALLTDLEQRGLADDVLVLVWGEFGRTPRVNATGGRDHWLAAGFGLFAGGGLKMGQIIGATDRTGAQVTSRPYSAQNVLATVYRVLGIDPATTAADLNNRPMHLLDDRDPIAELI